MKLSEELLLSGSDKVSDFPKKFNKLVRIVEKLVNVVSVLLAILITFLAQSFFSGQLTLFFGIFNINWGGLSEGYQLLILGFPLTILAGILIHIVNKRYVDPLIITNHHFSSK